MKVERVFDPPCPKQTETVTITLNEREANDLAVLVRLSVIDADYPWGGVNGKTYPPGVTTWDLRSLIAELRENLKPSYRTDK